MTGHSINEVRSRLLAIAGQANSLHLMLGDVSFTENRFPYIDHCTEKLCKELERLTYIVAQGIEQEKNNACRRIC